MLAALEGVRAPDLKGASLGSARLLVVETVTMDGIRSEPRSAFNSSVERLRAAGVLVERREVPLLEEVLEHSATVMAAEAYGTWRHRIDAAPEKMFPEILRRFKAGAEIAGADFAHAWQRIREVENAMACGYGRFRCGDMANFSNPASEDRAPRLRFGILPGGKSARPSQYENRQHSRAIRSHAAHRRAVRGKSSSTRLRCRKSAFCGWERQQRTLWPKIRSPGPQCPESKARQIILDCAHSTCYYQGKRGANDPAN